MVVDKIVNRQPECPVFFKAHSIQTVLFNNIVFHFTFKMNNIFFKGSALRTYITIKIRVSGKINTPIAFHHNLPSMTKCQKAFINELKLLTQL